MGKRVLYGFAQNLPGQTEQTFADVCFFASLIFVFWA